MAHNFCEINNGFFSYKNQLAGLFEKKGGAALKRIVVSSILPSLFLAVADIVTVVLVYAICSMVGGLLQPMVFFAVALALFALNLAILCYGRMEQRYGRRMARIKSVFTVSYYLLTVGFTLAAFSWIDSHWYLTASLAVLALYLICCAGLMLVYRGRNQEARVRQDEEAAKIRLLLLPIAQEIRESRRWLEPALYYRLSRKLGSVEHRLAGATPFGLARDGAVGQVEEQLLGKLTAARAAVRRLSHKEEAEQTAKMVLDLFEEIEYLAKSKEIILVETSSL